MNAFGVEDGRISKVKLPKPPKPLGKKTLKHLKKAGMKGADMRRLEGMGQPKNVTNIRAKKDQADFDSWMRDPNSKLTLNPNPPKGKKK
jgi:hypothetical protein